MALLCFRMQFPFRYFFSFKLLWVMQHFVPAPTISSRNEFGDDDRIDGGEKITKSLQHKTKSEMKVFPGVS